MTRASDMKPILRTKRRELLDRIDRIGRIEQRLWACAGDLAPAKHNDYSGAAFKGLVSLGAECRCCSNPVNPANPVMPFRYFAVSCIILS